MESKSNKSSYYAVARGKNIGIYLNWTDCKAQVDQFINPVFRKFTTMKEAEIFIRQFKESDRPNIKQQPVNCNIIGAKASQQLINNWGCPCEAESMIQSQKQNKYKINVNNDIQQENKQLIEQPRSTISKRKIPADQDPNNDYVEDFLIKVNINPQDCLFVFTDGGCRGNGHEGAIAGIGIFFSDNDQRNQSILVKGKSTNNIAELQAFIEVYKIIQQDIQTTKSDNKPDITDADSYSLINTIIRPIVIVSDSIYAIRCVTEYGKKCEQDNWIKSIPNKELVKQAYYMYKNADNVYFAHIMAHTNGNGKYSQGNANADALANQAMNSILTQ